MRILAPVTSQSEFAAGSGGDAVVSSFRTNTANCRPACGDPRPGGPFSCDRATVQTAIVSCLRRADGKFVSLDDLAEWVYAGDPDGGPEDARCVIAWAILRLRARGVPIENRHTGSYRLEPLT